MPHPAVFETEDGSHSLISDQFKVSYHSKHGAIQETAHVFIRAGLAHQCQTYNLKQISILEVGFGTGLNAFMTLLAGHEMGVKVTYQTIESHPIHLSIVDQLNYPELLKVPEQKALYRRLHESVDNQVVTISDQFHFKKSIVRLEDFKTSDQFDLIYFDAFAPTAQPELWEANIFKALYEVLNPNGILVTYCAKGVVKRTLKAVGFELESIPGPPGKREMTRAIKRVAE